MGINAALHNPIQDGKTALVMACEKGYREITELLLSAKAYINHQDNVSIMIIKIVALLIVCKSSCELGWLLFPCRRDLHPCTLPARRATYL